MLPHSCSALCRIALSGGRAVAFHDWVHPSLLFWPHQADRPEDVPGWDGGGLFPNGDYTIFVGRDYAFGVLGHPWERSSCVFGEPAVAAFTAPGTTASSQPSCAATAGR